MFSPFISLSAGDGFGVEYGVSAKTPVSKSLLIGAGTQYIITEPMGNEPLNDSRYEFKFYLPFSLSTETGDVFSAHIAIGPLFEYHDINIMTKLGICLYVDHGKLWKTTQKYRVYIAADYIIINYFTPNHLMQFGIGLQLLPEPKQ